MKDKAVMDFESKKKMKGKVMMEEMKREAAMQAQLCARLKAKL